MKLTDEYLKGSDIAYFTILEMEVEDAYSTLNKLLACNFDELIKRYSREELSLNIKELHQNTMLFKGNGLLSRLSQLNLDEKQLSWFVALDEIDEQFNLIMSKGIKVDRAFALIYIRVHLDFNFSMELLIWATGEVVDDNVRMSILSKSLSDISDRRCYNNGGDPVRSKDWLDSFLNNLLKESIEFNESNKSDLTIDLIDATKGKTEKVYLKALMERCFDYDKKQYSQTQFISIVYELFRIILIGYDLKKTEKDFWDVEGEYRNSFNNYKVSRLKGILKLNMENI